jgi:drug/metabolite transporter (DMT)-like permease
VVQPARTRAKVLEASTNANSGAFTVSDWLLFFSIAAVWGSSFLLIDIGLDALDPFVVTFARVALGAVVLMPFKAARRPIAPDDRTRLLVLSVVWVAVPFTLFPVAEQHINSSVTGMLNGGTPIFAAIIAAVLLDHRPGRAERIGLIGGLVGVITISVAQSGEGESAWFGIVMVVLATICYGYAINLAAPLQQRYGSLTVMAKMLALATIWTAPLGLWKLADSRFEVGPVLATVVLGAAGTGGAFVVMGTLVGRVGSTRASFTTYLIPVVAMILGVAFRQDQVRPAAGIGVTLVIAGAFLASRAKRT